jgi:hypothetical protein
MSPRDLAGFGGIMDRLGVLAVLAQIVHSGGSQQAEAAQALINQIDQGAPGAWEAAKQLADAYLNDPHLTRNPGDR